MVKIKYKKLQKNRAVIRNYIKWYSQRGYSANQIIKALQRRGYGIRRKVLLSEIRAVKRIPIKKERLKYTPRKYRAVGRWEKRAEVERAKIKEREKNLVYRVSLAANGIPIHSKAPLRPNYLSFLYQAFHNDAQFLRLHLRYFKDELLRLTGEYLGYAKSDWWFDFTIEGGYEFPTQIIDPLGSLSGTWLFQVEKDGSVIYHRTGAI